MIKSQQVQGGRLALILASRTLHQFRNGNDAIETQRMLPNEYENSAKSTKAINVPPLITVWLRAERWRAAMEALMLVVE
jgi:hypothetical protein